MRPSPKLAGLGVHGPGLDPERAEGPEVTVGVGHVGQRRRVVRAVLVDRGDVLRCVGPGGGGGGGGEARRGEVR
jgi:hypothetical protein